MAERGELYWFDFPYADDPTRSKPRPVCIVSSAAFNRRSLDVVVAKLTGRSRYWATPEIGDVPLQDWDQAGLPLRSTVRAGSLFSVAANRLAGPFGSLTAGDLDATDAALRSVLALE